MLKKSITYEDLEGNKVTEDFYFNLNKGELLELEITAGKKGFAEMLKAIVASEDGKAIVENFKMIILKAYGKKSEDGKRFIKNQDLRDEFEQSDAYSELFVSLISDAGEGARFVNGVVPANMAEQLPGQPHDYQRPAIKTVEDIPLPAEPQTVAPDLAPAEEPVQVQMSAEEYAAYRKTQG